MRKGNWRSGTKRSGDNPFSDRRSDLALRLNRATGDFYDFRRRSRRRVGLGSASDQERNGVSEDGERLKGLFAVPLIRETISAIALSYIGRATPDTLKGKGKYGLRSLRSKRYFTFTFRSLAE